MRTPSDAYGSAEQIRAVRAADPLRADPVCARLPDMNARADLFALTGALRGLLPDAARLGGFTRDECLAAMRDLGIVAGSVKRHGVQPGRVVPELMPVLRELGRRTDMVPRDTVLHYCVWNPTGERRRTYTGEAPEHVLQDAVRQAFPRLHAALELGEELSRTEPWEPAFAPLVHGIGAHTTVMVDVIDQVAADVSPEFFARTMRPYFEEFSVDGLPYLGPAAAQVPLWLVDEVVWLSDAGVDEYEQFVLDSVPYGLPRWRALHAGWHGAPSAVGRLLTAADGPRKDAVRAGAAALVDLLRTVTTFRGRHLRIARAAYGEDLRLYPVGSGGGSVDLLQEVLLLTRQNARLARERAADPTPTPAARRG
ncbi:monodechloroaminopyrrolnitrin synthase PrnB family protein [Streptomyces sp. GSL17-111]|uniref:monodechloroaminopyrrolnitrin synthase PrnB family protein n=1 Tax=Streptomyces sp. GSL17-111 TaxID=3121596 RepID=UPI0030F3C7BF